MYIDIWKFILSFFFCFFKSLKCICKCEEGKGKFMLFRWPSWNKSNINLSFSVHHLMLASFAKGVVTELLSCQLYGETLRCFKTHGESRVIAAFWMRGNFHNDAAAWERRQQIHHLFSFTVNCHILGFVWEKSPHKLQS